MIKKSVSSLKKNSLTKFGYSTNASLIVRHKALKKAVKAYGITKVISKLNYVSILNKNRSPKNSRIFLNDKIWVKNNFK